MPPQTMPPQTVPPQTAPTHAGPGHSRPGQDVMRAAKAPVGRGSLPLVAGLVALGLVALGALAVHDALAVSGAVDRDPVTTGVLDALDGLAHDAPVVLGVGIVAAVLGLLLLPVALGRRPRTSVDLDAATGVHLLTGDLERVVAGAVEGTDSVTDVSVRATRRKVAVHVTSLAPRAQRDEVVRRTRERVDPVLAALASPPRTSVTVRHEELR